MLLGRKWQVSYGSVSLQCKTEHDAKLLARELVKKGHRVSAGTLEGQSPQRSIGADQLQAWLRITEFHPRKLKNGRWSVIITTGYGPDSHVGDFATEEEAERWISANSKSWPQPAVKPK
jgi:hypothetical protein